MIYWDSTQNFGTIFSSLKLELNLDSNSRHIKKDEIE